MKKAKAAEEDEDEDFMTVGKGGKAIQFTPESIFKNLQVVQEARGKKVSPCRTHRGIYFTLMPYVL